MDEEARNKLTNKITGVDNGLIYLKLMEVEAHLRVIGNVTAHILAANQQKDIQEIFNNMESDRVKFLNTIAQSVIENDDSNVQTPD